MAVVHQDSTIGMLLPESLMFTLNISRRQPLPPAPLLELYLLRLLEVVLLGGLALGRQAGR